MPLKQGKNEEIPGKKYPVFRLYSGHGRLASAVRHSSCVKMENTKWNTTEGKKTRKEPM